MTRRALVSWPPRCWLSCWVSRPVSRLWMGGAPEPAGGVLHITSIGVPREGPGGPVSPGPRPRGLLSTPHAPGSRSRCLLGHAVLPAAPPAPTEPSALSTSPPSCPQPRWRSERGTQGGRGARGPGRGIWTHSAGAGPCGLCFCCTVCPHPCFSGSRCPLGYARRPCAESARVRALVEENRGGLSAAAQAGSTERACPSASSQRRPGPRLRPSVPRLRRAAEQPLAIARCPPRRRRLICFVPASQLALVLSIYTYMCAHTHAYTRACTDAHTLTHRCTCAYTHAHTRMYMCTGTHIIHAHMHTQRHMHASVHIHTLHILKFTPSFGLLFSDLKM